MSDPGVPPSSLDSLEAIPDSPNKELASRLRSLGLRRLALQVQDCGLRRRVTREGSEEPLHCRKRVCAACRRSRSLRFADHYASLIHQALGPAACACMLTFTSPPSGSPLIEAGLEVHRALRKFTETRIWRRLRRQDPSLGLATSFEIAPGCGRPGHPHGHALVVSRSSSTTASAAGAWLEHWMQLHPSASPAAQECTPETSDPGEVRDLLGYVTKGTSLDLAWPDAELKDVVGLLTSGLHLLTASGSLRKPHGHER